MNSLSIHAKNDVASFSYYPAIDAYLDFVWNLVLWLYNKKKLNEARALYFVMNTDIDMVSYHDKSNWSVFILFAVIDTFHIFSSKYIF